MMRIFRNITLLAAMIMATVACDKIEKPSSSFIRFRVDVENMEVGTKAGSAPGPNEFYMVGWYMDNNNNPAFYSGNHPDSLMKYSLNANEDYVIEGGETGTVEDNPEWCINKKSSFWACTAWGNSLPDVSETVNYTIYQKNSFVANTSYSGALGNQTYNMLDASQQSDYMVTYSEMSQGETVEDDILNLHFYHTLSKITFEDKTNGAIKSLKVDNTYNGGKVEVTKVGSIRWFQLNNTSNTKTISSFDNSMYLIPQGTESAKSTITITAVMQDNTEKTKTVNVAWQAGYEYKYRLNLASTEHATKAGNSDDCLTVECISEKKY